MILEEMYGDVLISDMLKSPVEYHHSDLIKKKSREIKMQYCFESVFGCFFSALFLYLAIGIVVVNGYSMDNLGAILIMMFFAITFFCVLIKDVRYIFNIRKGVKGCQYGIINSKYYITKVRVGKTDKSRFYANVTFEDNNKTLDKIICSQKEYRSINKGDRVLVVSYDDKKAYIVLLK